MGKKRKKNLETSVSNSGSNYTEESSQKKVASSAEQKVPELIASTISTTTGVPSASALAPAVSPGVGTVAETGQQAGVIGKFDHSSKRLIVVLERANLEAVKVGRNYELLNCDDHLNILRKHGRDIAEARPDICHQCLLTLLDSPLNKAGLLQVYVHTERNVLIEINPQTRIPRTYKRFAGLMVQLLHELSVKASDSKQVLLKVIKNPVTDHLPVNARIYGTSYKASKLVNIQDFVAQQYSAEGGDGRPVVFVIGSHARGPVSVDYVTEPALSFSQYALSGAYACSRVVAAFERLWSVL